MPIDDSEIDADDPLSADMVYRMAEAMHSFWEHLADDDISPNQAQTVTGHRHARSDDSEHIDRVTSHYTGDWLLKNVFIASGGGVAQAIEWRASSLGLVSTGQYGYVASADYEISKTSIFIVQDCEKFVCPSIWVDNQWDDTVTLTATLAGDGVTLTATGTTATTVTEWKNLIIDITDVAGMTGWFDFYFTMTLPSGSGTVTVHSADGWSQHWDSDKTGISYTNNVASSRTDY